MNGLLLVDKPAGLSSFDIVRSVRRWCATRQVGHGGTLDPAATGVLPVAVGSVTRLTEYLLDGDKEYLAVMHLGVTTATQDGEGEIIARSELSGIDQPTVAAALEHFRGAIEQVPPMYSALKRDGVPLYRLARRGEEVERQPRPVTIHSLELVDCTLPLITLRVSCSKGTYIRTLCHDIGAVLGCGAHMARLRRTRCGGLSLERCTTYDRLAELAAAGAALPLIPAAQVLPGFPAAVVKSTAWPRLGNGVAPRQEEVVWMVGEAPPPGVLVSLLANGELAAIARFVPGGEGGRPGDFSLEKVFLSVAWTS